MKNKTRATIIVISLCLGISALTPGTWAADPLKELSKGQTIYVPAYSHIYSGNREMPFLLTVTLSIRNIDPHRSIRVTRVDYYETQGKLLEKHLDAAKLLNPLESIRFIIPEKDTSGGSGANFMVQWESDQAANPPIVECIMISTRSKQGISFTSRGQVITPSR